MARTSSPKTWPHSSERLVRGQDDRALFVMLGDHLEDQVRPGTFERLVADLIDNQDTRPQVGAEFAGQPPGCFGGLRLRRRPATGRSRERPGRPAAASRAAETGTTAGPARSRTPRAGRCRPPRHGCRTRPEPRPGPTDTRSCPAPGRSRGGRRPRRSPPCPAGRTWCRRRRPAANHERRRHGLLGCDRTADPGEQCPQRLRAQPQPGSADRRRRGHPPGPVPLQIEALREKPRDLLVALAAKQVGQPPGRFGGFEVRRRPATGRSRESPTSPGRSTRPHGLKQQPVTLLNSAALRDRLVRAGRRPYRAPPHFRELHPPDTLSPIGGDGENPHE